VGPIQTGLSFFRNSPNKNSNLGGTTMSTLVEQAKSYIPRNKDPFGKDKKIFLNYLSNYCVGFENKDSNKNILNTLKSKFRRTYNKESLQHNLIVPLREEFGFFVGTSSKGIYLVKDADDALTTMNFYSKRIRSEEKHLRNLKVIVQRNKLFRGFVAGKKLNRPVNVYFDESGTPNRNNSYEDPFFIVTGVVIDSRIPFNLLNEKLIFIRKILKKNPDYELKSNNLSIKEHKLVINELRTIDYEFASVCFIKEKLQPESFQFSSSFYKYANNYLVEKLLDRLEKVNLFFDQYGDPNSSFEEEFIKYIKLKNNVWPKDKIENIKMFDSKTKEFIQIADLIAGAIGKTLRGKGNYWPLLEEKKLDIYWFPYQ
jgi:hypothetical protein